MSRHSAIEGSAMPADGSDRFGARVICDAVRLFDLCRKSKCRRAGACRGVPQDCIRRHAQLVPREVWDWVGAVLEARDDGLSDDDFAEAIEPHVGAIVAWVVGLQHGRAARRMPRPARGATIVIRGHDPSKDGRERPIDLRIHEKQSFHDGSPDQARR